jgi:hypothetical protein
MRGPRAEMVSHLIAKNPDNVFERTEKGFSVRLTYPIFSQE